MPTPFDRAMALFDAVNAEDPNAEVEDGQPRPKELLYAERMSTMLARFAPDASDAVRLACRAQHIRRWAIPRSDYPQTREGYHQWRTTLYRYHAEQAAVLMQQAGYDDASIEQVKKIVGKRGIKVNPETQLLEDIASLVFIEYYLQDFAEKKPDYDEEKWLGILRKTWQKMSAKGREFALSGGVKLPESQLALIGKAVAAL